MPENNCVSGRGYFEVKDEGGVVNIAHSVVASIAAMACQEVHGVAGMANVQEAMQKGIKLTLDEQGACKIEAHVMARMGTPLTEVAEEAQKAVKTAIETGTGIPLSAVDVYVAGVSVR